MTHMNNMQFRCYLVMIITLNFFGIKQVLIATDRNYITKNEHRTWKNKTEKSHVLTV